jgi:hypothetical protein
LGKLAAGRQPFAKADNPGKGVEHGEPAIGWSSDQQAAIVGSEVKRTINVALVASAERRSGSAGRSLEAGARPSGDLLRHRSHALFILGRTGMPHG